MKTYVTIQFLVFLISFSSYSECKTNPNNADTTNSIYSIPNNPSAICGEDTRISSYEKAVGRIVGYYSNNLNSPILIATGFIIPNGRLVTAAHVFYDLEPLEDKTIVIEFEVKLSGIGGNIVPSDPQHRYVIDKTSINKGGLADGYDWAVFDVYPNSITGLYAIDPNAQGTFMAISIDVVNQIGVDMKVIGYGYDSRNLSKNHTQQSATGLGSGFNPPNEDAPYLEYDIDTQSGCSGGPVIWNNKVVGVHNRSYALNLCPNYGTQTAQSNFSYYLTSPSTFKYVTVQQTLENSANKEGYIGRW